MSNNRKRNDPRRTLQAVLISACFVPPSMAAVQHTDGDATLLAGPGVITLDATDANGVLQNGNLTPSTSKGNVVYVTGTPANTNTVYGVYCSNAADCEAENNTVIMDAGSVRSLYGTRNLRTGTNVNTGTVNLYGGSVGNSVYGIYLYTTASANSNSYANASGMVNLYGGSVGGSVYGSSALAAVNSAATTATSIAHGKVNLYSGMVKGNIYGAMAANYAPLSSISESTATGEVNLYGGTVGRNVYGAYSSAKFTTNAEATTIAHGMVTIADDAKLQREDANGTITYTSEVWGGYLDGTTTYYDVFSGNTLNMRSAPLTVTRLGNFEYYNFAINDHNSSVINNADSALVTVTSGLVNNDTVSKNDDGTSTTTTNKSRVKLTGVSGQRTVNAGDTINLIKLASGATVTQGGTSASTLGDFFDLTGRGNTINVGLVKTAEVSYSTTADAVVATIGKTSGIGATVSDERIRRNVTPLAEGRLAALQGVTRGADALQRVMSALDTDVGVFTPVAILDGGSTRYNSGSHVDSRDYRFVVGSRYQATERLSGALVMEYGRSNFDTYNHFDAEDIHGNGRTYNVGPALSGRYSLPVGRDTFYMEAGLRAGRASTEYGSGDIITGGGMAAAYKSRANYAGGSLGTGYVYALNGQYGLDSSVRYLYTRLGSDSVDIDGDTVNFGSSVSSRAQLKEQLSYQATKQVVWTLAGIYEYEFAGDAKTDSYGVGIDAPSVQGSTGIMELGLKTTPVASHPELGIDLSFRGYTGQREGVSGSMTVQYNF